MENKKCMSNIQHCKCEVCKPIKEKEKIEQLKPSYWLNCTDDLMKLGFSENDINEAIIDSGNSIETLTKKKYFENEPYYSKNKLIRKNVTFSKKKYFGNTEYYKYVQVKGNEYRIPSEYQGLKHGEIIGQLLKNRYHWFNSFKWNIYELHNLENFELYMKTSDINNIDIHLYVPIKAITTSDFSLIEKRMISYWKWYFKDNNEKLERVLKVLDSKESLKLKQILGYIRED